VTEQEQPAQPSGVPEPLDVPPLSETDERFAERLAEDLARILGAGIIYERLELADADGGPSRIRVVCLFDGRAEVLESEAETAQAARDQIVRAAAQLRLAIATRNMIAPI
jgi:hypothetical protein